MPYYTRVFCTSTDLPALAEIGEALRRQFSYVRFEADDPLDDEAWTNAELYYAADKQPIVLEINRNDGPDSLVAEESQEFIEEVRSLESPAGDRICSHLENTMAILSCQLLGDIKELGFDVNGELMNHFVNHCGGLVHADGEGFYQGSELVLELK